MASNAEINAAVAAARHHAGDDSATLRREIAVLTMRISRLEAVIRPHESMRNIQAVILTVLRNGEDWTRAEITDACHYTPDYVSTALNRLCAQGAVIRLRHGMYRIADGAKQNE